MQTKTVPLLRGISPNTPVTLTAQKLHTGSRNRYFSVQDGIIHSANSNGLTAGNRKFQRLDNRMRHGYDVAGEIQKFTRHTYRNRSLTGGFSEYLGCQFYCVTFRKT